MDNSDNTILAESSGDPNAQAKTSSALGLGQFVNATWLEMIRRYRPKLAQGKSEAEILELRKDPHLSKDMAADYAKENQTKLRQAGLPVTPGSTYLMHFAGPSGGVALMKADPNTPVESILTNQAIKANPFLQGKTASWVIAWANKKMADAAAANEKMADAAAKKSSAWPQPTPRSAPFFAQTETLDPAFGATSWPPRPASANVLPPDAARPFAGAPRVGRVPFTHGTIQVQQALDNSLPAPGAPPWAFSDRFGRWDNFGGVSGPTTSGGSSGLGQTGDGNDLGADGAGFGKAGVDPSRPPLRLAPDVPQKFRPFTVQDPSLSNVSDDASDVLSSEIAAAPVRRVTTMFPYAGSLHQNLPASPSAAPFGVLGGQPNAPSRPPMSFPHEALLAPDRNRASDEWASSKLRDNGGPSAPSLPTPNLPASNLPAASVFDQGTAPVPYTQDAAQDAPGGLLGRLMRMSAFDPSDPDPPPAGGLLALIQQSIRNNPDGSATR